ncbi:MAG: hypothetical protein KGR17_00065 [Acidobacteria bacterium]|nr:hypothetical protein [Acidobacteriota bacterium]
MEPSGSLRSGGPTDPAEAQALEALLGSGDPVASALSADPVLGVVDRVRADLAARRARGELPSLPADELVSHFEGVVEAVDAGLVEQPPLEVDELTAAAALPAWRPVPTGGPLKRIAVVLIQLPARVIGLLVRRQVGEFATRTAEVAAQIADRQTRISRFLARAHLERIRSLEYRVAQLEDELRRARDGEPADIDG